MYEQHIKDWIKNKDLECVYKKYLQIFQIHISTTTAELFG